MCTVCKEPKDTERGTNTYSEEKRSHPPASTTSPATIINDDQNLEAFVLVKRTVRHKICRGCGQIKEKLAPPYDYLLRHHENYTYFDKSSHSQKPTSGNRFYHVNMDCVRAKHRYVTESDFIIPELIKSTLSDQHMKHFKKCGLFSHLS
jgi:hypothetical protein